MSGKHLEADFQCDPFKSEGQIKTRPCVSVRGNAFNIIYIYILKV